MVEGACGIEVNRYADAPSTVLTRDPPSPLRGAGKEERGRLPMPDPEWLLHPQLAADTMLVGDLALSRPFR
jgi:hypothetical protein